MLIESNKVELKSKYTDQIVKEIVSFLNSDGGKIYIGVNDDGTVCGASKIDETLRNISDIVTSQIEPNASDAVKSGIDFVDGLPVYSDVLTCIVEAPVVVGVGKFFHSIICT